MLRLQPRWTRPSRSSCRPVESRCMEMIDHNIQLQTEELQKLDEARERA